MNKDYTSYTSRDFLLDEYFLQWQLYPDEENNAFWNNWMETHPESIKEIEQAIAQLKCIQLNRYTFSMSEKGMMLRDIQQKIRHDKKKRRILSGISFSIAACASLLIILSIFFHRSDQYLLHTQYKKEIGLNSADTTQIQLILADNNSVTLEDNSNLQYSTSGNLIVSSSGNQVSTIDLNQEDSKRNKLIVPKGRRSSLVLADGTKLWVNSGTILEFPNHFAPAKREIFVEGEIYIEVAKNSSQPFIVNTAAFQIEVLGTCFNVSAYKDDYFNSVVLVKGKVNVVLNDNNILLKPNQMLYMESDYNGIRNVDVTDYISWKDGVLQFRSEPLLQILKRVSRYYDVKIECEQSIQQIKCTGKLILFDDMENVLQAISNTIPVKFEIKENNVIFIPEAK